MLSWIAILLATLALTSLCVASDGGDTPELEAATVSAAAVSDVQTFAFESPARSPEFLASLGLTPPPASTLQQACCKICSRGKACGNTCISRDKTCHVGPGCACDG